MACEGQRGPGSAHRSPQAACGSVPWGGMLAPALRTDLAGIFSEPGCDEGRARRAPERLGVSWPQSAAGQGAGPQTVLESLQGVTGGEGLPLCLSG